MTHLDMISQFERYLASFGILSAEEINDAVGHVQIRQLNKADFLVHEGGICKEVAFVASGLLRTFYVDTKADEVTYCITFPGNMITAYSSFITGNRKVENIQAIENTDIITIKKQAVDELSHDSLNWTRFLKVMAEHQYMELEQRIFQLQKHEAAERYRNLLRDRPEYIKQIPLQYLASYLGITQRHLSRIRKEVF